MNLKEILIKAIDRAENNKWDSNNKLADAGECPYEHYHIIFSHDFAKAFFGDGWGCHLQQMVLKEIPLKYLVRWLK